MDGNQRPMAEKQSVLLLWNKNTESALIDRSYRTLRTDRYFTVTPY